MRYRLGLVALAAMAAALLGAAPHRASPAAAAWESSTLNRPADPLVLTGADVPSLQGLAPNDVVAFAWDAGAWQQVPVQVDQRMVQSFNTIYNNSGTFYGGFSTLVYADPNTFTGADPNPTIDADDEIAFMAKDAGGRPPAFSEPAGVVHDSGVEVQVADPLDPAAFGWVYLFHQDGTLDPAAGKQYVSYDFNLLSGSYLATYNTVGGPNPENSTVSSSNYSFHFGDRWQEDELHITTSGASGVDILDRHKALFAPGYCVRTEDTFDNGDPWGYKGEGAFVVNRTGPVRAIRSFIGANSGPRTQREYVFYQQRTDIRTFLRVHPIPSVMDFYDYSPAATGMTYYNNLNLGGVAIDGNPDTPATGPITWEMVTGGQGAVVMAGLISTDIPGFNYTSYYLDSTTPPVTQCTGDAYAYGSSGVWVMPPPGQANIPCTDPSAAVCTGANHLDSTRVMYFEPPGETTGQAQTLSAQAEAPLTYSAARWQLDTDGDGYPDAQELAMGKDPAVYCAIMRADVNGDGKVNLLDLGAMAAQFGKAIPPAPLRLDQNADSRVNLLDLGAAAARFGHSVSECP